MSFHDNHLVRHMTDEELTLIQKEDKREKSTHKHSRYTVRDPTRAVKGLIPSLILSLILGTFG
jgi:hypothetical protein